MAEGSLLVDLLFAAQEPGEAKYERISSDILTRPDILANLFRNGQDSLLLLRQARRGHRLVKIFGSLFSLSNQQYHPLHLNRLAITCSSLFTRIISNSKDTDLDLLVAAISPALKICLGSGLREARGLATVLVQHDGLLERVINNDLGAAAISSWTFSPVIRQQDVFTLGSCADKLVDLVSHCAAEHHHSEELASWEDLKYLTKSLKQAGRTQQNLHNGPFLVEAGDAKFLAKFCLTIPESIRKLSETIQELETRKTIAILQALANTFPCNLCRETLRRGAPIQFINTASTEFHHPRTPQFGMEVFGRNIGHWEVLLSTPALSALLNRHQMKTLTIIKEKLSTLARGMHHKTALAGCRPARQLLKVPLSITQCRSDIFIVWQIDVDMLYETGSPGQIIRVWDIVTASEIERLLEHVTVIQSTWTEETINRCRQGSSFNLEERTPVIYHPSSTGEIVADLRKRINLDVRSKDQYFYNLIGKFFPFTESFFNHRDNRRASLDFPYKLSSYEKEIVCQSNTSSIIRGRSGTGKTTCLVYKLLGKHIASKQMGQDRPLKQILLTRSLQLADKIRHDVRRILETLLPGSDSDAKVQNITASAFMDRTFVNPPDPLYPLVCTFEEFLERLENTASVFDAPEQQEQDRPQNVVDQRNANETRDDCVDYPKFKEEYWPILSRENEQKLPMSLVFAEIMGVIKGSNASAVSLGPLTCEEYLQQSSRIAPAFAIEAERIALYKLFRSYEKLKCERNEVDYVDRVLNVLSSLQKTPALKQILQAALDEVYIDEVQDQRSVDVKLLLTLVGDVRCFHVAGDNAQAIAQESNFRFEDLKAMIHTHFSDGSDTNKKPFKRPQMFELGLNYRSHDGIVRLGSFVMGLLWKCFPETVDKLKPEEGLLLGPIPILFVGCEPDILAKVSNEESTLNVDKVKFGAEQVVLVRDEQEKARLKNYIGGVALVLTIRQSKGMEFDDVVLFDFFTSSPEPGGWRNVHEVLGDKPANFDSQRYITMCAELKNLYVSVTRARNKLFIIETGSHYSLSFIAQLLTHCTPESVVKLIKRDDYEFNQNIQLLRPDRMTNPKRWIERGSDLMTDGHYREALHCFEQANHHHGIKLVEAKIHQAEGNACFAIHDRVAAAEAFNSSITLFLELHQTEDAVGICCKMGWLERAAGLWFDQHDYHKAARLFNNAKLYIRAAECYENLQMFSEAAEVLWRGEEFNELVRCLVHHRQDFPPLILDTYVSLCKVPLKGKKLSTSHRKEVISLMGPSKEREDLLRRYEIYDVLDELLLQEKRFSDLFRLRCDLGDLDGALELTLRGKQIGPLVDVEEQIQQLTDHVVTGRLLDNLKRRKKISDKILGDLRKSATTEQQKRVREWSLAINCLESDDGLSVSKIGLIHSDLMRLVIALQILDLDSMGKRPPLETLLSRRIQTAIAITKDAILMGVRAQNLELLLTVCGVWNTGNPQRPYIVKAWSPLPKETALATFDDTTLAAKNWLTNRLSTFIASLDDASEYWWNISYPWRCTHFLTKGFPAGTYYASAADSKQEAVAIMIVVHGNMSMSFQMIAR